MSSPTPERNPNSRVPRSPSPAPLPNPPTSAKLPPRPSTTTTSHVSYARQSLGPGGPPLSAAANGTYALGTGGLGGAGGRNFSSPSGNRNSTGRPVSEILGGSGLGGRNGGDGKATEAETIDQWFQDLASYEVTLEEMAAASLDQNFTEELSAIEQWFRVLSEAERTAALYSLLQHSTQVQIRFFMTVLQQMSGSDPMSAMLSPAGGGMQSQMEAKLANLNMRSPNARASFGANGNTVPSSASRDSFGGHDASSYLTPESALANAEAAGSARKSSNKSNNRISAPGTLNSLGGASWGGAGQLDQVLERGPSPSGEMNSSPRSNGNGQDSRPKSTDFSGSAVVVPGSSSSFAAARSPRLSGHQEQDAAYPSSPNAHGSSWASMTNTPVTSSMFSTNHSTMNDQFSPSLSAVPKLSDAPKRRSSSRVSLGADNGALYNKDGELVIPGQSSVQQQQSKLGRGLQSPGSIGGGFQGAGNGAWARSPSLGNDGNGGFGNNFGLGVGGLPTSSSAGPLSNNFTGLGSPSANDLAFQMSQLQLQQLQLQQLQQLQQLGVGATGLGMGLPSMAGLGGLGMGQIGANGNGGFGGMGGNLGMNGPRSASLRSVSAQRSPMMGGTTSRGPSMTKSSSPSGRRESSGVGAVEEDTDIRVLEDVPQWLRTLRLHKYTPNFENSNWRDMVVMTDADLEAKGVAALGARRKLLKTFESVRAQMGITDPVPVAASSAPSEGGKEATGDDA